jgi:hypothetical protein
LLSNGSKHALLDDSRRQMAAIVYRWSGGRGLSSKGCR